MSQLLEKEQDPSNKLEPDDPLAELARIVSSGSVFSSPLPTAPMVEQSGNKTAGIDDTPQSKRLEEPVNLADMAPASEAVAVSRGGHENLDDALSSQLAAELANELSAEPFERPEIETFDPPTAYPNIAAPVQQEEKPSIDLAAFVAKSAEMTDIPEQEMPLQPVNANPIDDVAPTDEAPLVPINEPLQTMQDTAISAAPTIAQSGAIPASLGSLETDIDKMFEEEFTNVPIQTEPQNYDNPETVISEAPDVVSQPAMTPATQSTAFDNTVELVNSPAIKPNVTAGFPDFSQFEQDKNLDVAPKDIDPLDTIQFDSEDDDFTLMDDGGDGGSRYKGLLAIVAIVLLAAMGAVVSYFYLGFGSQDGSPIIVAASDEEVRVKPDDPGGKTIPNQDRTVYETLTGANNSIVKDESSLVDRAEKPIVNVNQPENNAQIRVTLPRLAGQEDNVSATTPSQGPRKVRTVIVRPDGTFVADVESAEAAAVQESAAIATTNNASALTDAAVNESVEETVVPQSDIQTTALPELLEQAPSNTPPSSVVEVIESAQEGSVAATAPAVIPAVPVARSDNESVTPSAPVQLAALPPVPRLNTFRAGRAQAASSPENQSLRVTGTRPEQTSTATTAAVPVTSNTAVARASGSTAIPTRVSSGGFVVQLSALRSADQARADFTELRRRYSLLAPFSPNIQRADLGDRGVFHRLRVGPFSRGDANQLCQDLLSAGAECIVRRN